jgi:outer membrane lipopolysaccharide assembly protein LptE/RlpB
MRTLLITFAAIAMTTTGAFAFGQDTIDANQAVQAQRIEQGRYSGELTRREYRALKAEQARIADMESRAKADGYVSRREYNKIHDTQIQAYRHIKSETHDEQVSFWRRWLYNSRY